MQFQPNHMGINKTLNWMHSFNRIPYLYFCIIYLLRTKIQTECRCSKSKISVRLSVLYSAKRLSRELNVIKLMLFFETDDRELNVILRVERVTTDWIAFDEHGYVEPRSALLCWYHGVEAAFFGSFVLFACCLLFVCCGSLCSIIRRNIQHTI